MKLLLHNIAAPLTVFAIVLVSHIIWRGFHPEQDSIQSQWAASPSSSNSISLTDYFETGEFWFGYSYALSLAFAAVAMQQYRKKRICCARNMAIGGITFTGFLAIAGCFLIGCCGSPMLIVFLNLFGAAFFPLAKPIMAGITTLTIGLAWWWMMRDIKIKDDSGELYNPCE